MTGFQARVWIRFLSNVIRPKFVVKSLSNNVGLKVFALLTAILLFSLVHSEEEARRAVMVDVVALLPEPRSGKLLVSELPAQIKVTLKGSRSRIRAIQREDLLPVQMDLTDGANRYFNFDPASIDVPAGVDIVQVEPAAVSLRWAKATDKSVPVRARLTGVLSTGLEIRPAAVPTPLEVSLRGPEDEMRTIHEVRSAAVAIDGLGPGMYERLVPLETLPRNVRCLQEMVVRVGFGIVPVMVERTLYQLSLAPVGPGKAFLRPSRVAVTVRGPATVLSQIDPRQVTPAVDISEVKANAAPQAKAVTVSGLPAGTEVLRINPPEVWVKLR
jgi:YbbR domain-containing protein